jgi:hypothetical protein
VSVLAGSSSSPFSPGSARRPRSSPASSSSRARSARKGVGAEAAWVAIIVGLISFVVAFFLFSGSNLARILVTISFVLSLLTAVFALISNPANLVAPIISGLVAVIGIALLYTKRANEFFRR